ncbi:3-oxoacyl-ACP reductase FabG [Lacticaseibacillus baoqingensis]|uniref:3-oxoacyl-ACP reductase FabG n=1 Tax=Lacticaseibacillus baoqingensis TaxID=2486013 RepID=A0ABW4E5E0_9LACO|nr:3-oxoacyl-ACP reductase FabG [Lacticaseibacillus baoqingensis]
MTLTGQVALVTGATRGIGAAIALRLAQEGADLMLSARSAFPAPLLQTLKAYGGQVETFQGGIEAVDAAAELAAQTIAHYGRIDILVNNAGITHDQLALRLTPAQFAEVVNVNLNGTYNVTQPVYKAMMKARRGVIINLASIVGMIGNIGQANYAASKAGIIGLTKTLAKEGARRGVRVNAIAPGMIATSMTAALSEQAAAKVLANIPLNRFGTPAEVADAAAFLIGNAYVTGQVLTVDGGLT